MTLLAPGTGPHAGLPVTLAGAPLAGARAAVLLLHGRAGTPQTMLRHALRLGQPDLALLAPQALDRSWYPVRFIRPPEQNAEFLASALSVVEGLVAATGLPPGRVALMGFSQGACVSLEAVARRRAPLGAAIACSGGLMGDTPPEVGLPEPVLAGMPVLLGSSRGDRQIPLARVLETEAALRDLGANVTLHLWDGALHGVTEEEIGLAATMLAKLGS